MISIEYAAGLFDGEGYIGLVPHSKKQYGWYDLVCTIAITDASVLPLMAERWGGTVVELPPRPGCRRTWRWSVWSSAACQFLRDICSSLVIKRAQAEMALQYRIALIRDRASGAGSGRGRPLTPEEGALREGYYLAMRQAKKAA